MQLIVLGMHRSGTSTVTRLLNLAGAYFGEDGDATESNEENPKGFWERRDIRAVCDGLLHDSGADWWKISAFDVASIDPDVADRHLDAFRDVVAKLDEHKPWVIKEPRLCLLLPVLLPALTSPVCIHVHREPLEVAASIQRRNGFPLAVGIALWEHYTLASLKASAGFPRIQLRYEDVMQSPADTLERLLTWLAEVGVDGLAMPEAAAIDEFIDPALHRNRREPKTRPEILNARQVSLAKAIDTERVGGARWTKVVSSQGSTDTLTGFEAKQVEIVELAAELAETSRAKKATQNESDRRETARKAAVAAHKATVTERDAALRRAADLERAAQRAAREATRAAEEADTVHRREIASAERRLSKASTAADEVTEEARRLNDHVTAVIDDLVVSDEGLKSVAESRAWKLATASITLRQQLTPGQKKATSGTVERVRARTAQDLSRLRAVSRSLDKVGSEAVTTTKLPSGRVLKRVGPASESGDRPSVAVISWDVGHNPLGRAYIMAEMLQQHFDVELWGAQFPRYGDRIWPPLRGSRVPINFFDGSTFPAHLDAMEEVASQIDADLIWVAKPRLPSLGLGALVKQMRNRPLVLDVDDHELSFFGADVGMALEDLSRVDRNDLEWPFEEAWTRACEPMIGEADLVTVSNVALESRFGGMIVPHARDERVFDPERYDREQTRADLGVDPDDRLLLFGGTPRIHKGVIEIIDALERLDDPRYRLALFATRELDQLRDHIGDRGRWIVPIRPTRFHDLAPLVQAADLSCVLQDPTHVVSPYQLPAKITDAMAMGVPCLVNDVPPLRPYLEHDLLELTRPDEPLEACITRIFDDAEATSERTARGRQFFLDELSYRAVSNRLAPTFHELLADPPPASEEIEALLESIRVHTDQAASREPGELASVDEVTAPAPRRPGDRRRDAEPGESYDLVIFWKQNDTSIYGRRQDMFLEYLRRSGRFAKIIHFDNPISPERLIETYRQSTGPADQSRWVVRQTMARLAHRRDDGVIIQRTFLHRGKRSRRLRLRLRAAYPDFVAETLKRHGIGQERLVVFWVYPTNEDFPAIADLLRPDLVVCDVVDDNRTWYEPGHERFENASANYSQVLGRSDLVLANCAPVAASMTEFADDVHVVPNGCELPDAFVPGPRPTDFPPAGGPILGYVGNLSDRLDLALLDELARRRPDWRIVLIGSAHRDQSVLDLDRHPNVHFLGVKPYDEVKGLLHHLDVALIPHVDNAMTQAMNPLKAFVYAAAGLPIVSTPVANLDELGDLITVAEGTDGFIAAIEHHLADEPRPPDTEALTPHAWTSRVAHVLELLDAAATAPAPADEATGAAVETAAVSALD